MKQTPWVERKFNFDYNETIFPAIMDRLEGTVVRLRHKVAGLPPELLILKPEGKWSIVEHIGHLTDLESLWKSRLDQILRGESTLAAADMSNQATDLANHNAKGLDRTLEEFTQSRRDMLAKLRTLTSADIYKSAIHPRLQTPMRIMDLALFVAEHDDHHLVQINGLIQGRATPHGI